MAGASLDGTKFAIVLNFPSIDAWSRVDVLFALGDTSGHFTHRNAKDLFFDCRASGTAITSIDDLSELMESLDEV